MSAQHPAVAALSSIDSSRMHTPHSSGAVSGSSAAHHRGWALVGSTCGMSSLSSTTRGHSAAALVRCSESSFSTTAWLSVLGWRA